MFEKVDKQRFICSIKLHFSGKFELINLSGDLPYVGQRFYESIHNGSYDSADPYFSRGSFNFSESSAQTESGILYKQQATWRFPSNDLKRAVRIDQFQKTKYLEFILNDGTSFIMGRNDVFQNRAPLVETDSTFHMTEVKISSESIQPIIQIHQPTDDVEIVYGYSYIYNFELS